MSDDEGPKYRDGEIVWVKLGSCWWPGEVTENGPEDFTAKKPPLAIVKFFNEDTYEFVKTHNNIHPYNCERKNEFIKKGMDSFRGHNTHMEKFPGDVSLAEIRTDGNPNILSDPIFAPQKKTNVIAEVFGSPSPKKTPKDGKHKSRSSTSKNSSKKQTKVNITHRRFLGCDDYEAHVRVQYPGKDAEHLSSDEEEIARLNKEPSQTFNCSQCSFNTTRLEVMLFHVQCHIKGITTPVQTKKKQIPKKKKPRVVHKHITSDDDRTNSSAGFLDTDSEEEKPKTKRKKRAPTSPNKQPKPKVQKVEEEKTVADIRSNLLAEWSDSEDNEDMDTTNKPDISEESLNLEKDIVEELEKEEEPKLEEQQKTKEKVEDQTSKDLKSCFDFDEDDEEEENIVPTTVGRKIPRVIPPSDKRKSTDNDDSSIPSIEDDDNRIDELVKESENSNENVPNVVDLAKQEEIFKSLMESTVVPDLPDVPDSSKPAQNFSESKPVKIPDKQKENISEVATKLTNPKKRFVKSFEDFELLQNEQRRAQEEREEELKKEKVTVVESVEAIVETPVVETQVDPEPLVELPPDIIEAPRESPPPPVEPPVVEEQPQQEIVEEQINDSVEETVEVSPIKDTFVEEPKFTENSEPESKPVIPENDSEIESKKEEPEFEETDEVFRKLDGNLQISKLKCQIMSKLSDEFEEVEPVKSVKSKTSHRSPRSKILESYRNDKSKEKTRKSTEEQEESTEETKKEHYSPKKSKYLRLSKDEAESIEKIEEENSKDEPSKSEVLKQIEEIPEKNSDEEIGKINQIDEYFNDFLFNIPKKQESPPKEEIKTDTKSEEIVEEKQPSNEIQITCAGNDDDDPTISIKTNLTNLNRDEGEMSALSTLAMVSELETNVERKEEEKVEENLPESIKEQRPEPELVPIDGNLTVVSEKDLADAQVEITAIASPTCKKPVTLTSFSMDFSESNSNSTTDSLTSDIIDSKKEEVKKIPGPDDVFDIEEHIPSQIVDKPKLKEKEPSSLPSSKLLERLTEPKSKDNSVQKYVKVPITKDSTKTAKTKMILKSSSGSNKSIKGTASQSNKPIILSEKIIKPVKPADPHTSVSVQKITSKRNLQDADEIDAFIIQKGGSKTVEEDEETDSSITEDEIPVKKGRRSTAGMDPKKLQVSSSGTSVKKRGKAKILQQTIITPAGEIIQPNVTTKTTEVTTATPTPAAPPPSTTTTAVTTIQDDNVFDINSMPIVLSDQILTPESIENMPILYTDTTVQTTAEPVTPTTTVAVSAKVQTVVKKTPVTIQSQTPMRVLNKSVAASPATKLVKTPKIIGTVGSKLIKQNSFSSGSSKHGKYVIVTQSPATSTVSKYTVGKNKPLVKRVTADLAMPTAGTLTKVQNVAPEPTGNKIMILTDDKGQQQRVLLTPAQQKMMGYQTQGAKLTKTIVKGNVIQKSKDGQLTAIPGSSGLISRAITPSRINSNQALISSSGHVLSQIHPQQGKTMRIEKSIPGRKIQMQSQKVPLRPPQQKTILIKNQHGQTVRKIQGTDDALLDKQVAEQIEAIKASGVLQQKQEMLNYKSSPKTIRRSYAKKIESTKPQLVQKTKSENVVPPLAPISPKKADVVTTQAEGKQERALHQLVIQDAMGNQTTITEGQILALPSETVDGQPQSYMLVTLDESGNLTPLNNEALLSLDPNLGLGGDLGNTVLQIDQSALKETTPQVEVAKTEPVVTEAQQPPPPPPPPPQAETPKEEDKPPETGEASEEQIVDSSVIQAMGESGQQLIVTGDPIAAQKFLESLTEGNSDLANILASAEGSSILIHADGQQILINTDSDNQMLLSVNTDNMTESSEGGGNPIFATQPAKNQDILAAALADTDVFQQEQNGAQGKAPQLSPNSALYPMNVGNVLETSLTLNSPIMTPLEVPSTNSKKISDESDILNQVPKNVDLPITITDPNISQTVSQQQVASLMVNELQSNLELSLPISEAAITVPSTEMNSPSFVYSLPSLDAPDINQKPFNSSMPLLTEDSEEGSNEPKEQKPEEPAIKTTPDEKEEPKTDSIKISPEGSFLDESEGLCTLGGEMCSSLSEPPPDMFDLSAVLSSHQMKAGSASPKEDKTDGLVIMEEAELKIDDKGGDESVSSESVNPDTASVTETSSPNTVNEDSCEIPVQPNIVTTLKEDGFGEETTGSKREGEEIENDNNKKCKFDD